MDITIYSKVTCLDGPCGRLTHLVIKPTTEAITHLVISNESFPESEYLVPAELLAASETGLIRLNCSCDEMAKMPVYDRVQFIPSTMDGYVGGFYMMWPYYIPQANPIRLEKEHIPADELSIRRGAGVYASDGHIGRVDGFLINPENDHITHLLLREGHLWGQRDVSIPVSQIDHYAENEVYVKLTKRDIETLPPIPLKERKVKQDHAQKR